MSLLVLLVRPPVDTAVGTQLASRANTLGLTHDEIENLREGERERKRGDSVVGPGFVVRDVILGRVVTVGT